MIQTVSIPLAGVGDCAYVNASKKIPYQLLQADHVYDLTQYGVFPERTGTNGIIFSVSPCYLRYLVDLPAGAVVQSAQLKGLITMLANDDHRNLLVTKAPDWPEGIYDWSLNPPPDQPVVCSRALETLAVGSIAFLGFAPAAVPLNGLLQVALWIDGGKPTGNNSVLFGHAGYPTVAQSAPPTLELAYTVPQQQVDVSGTIKVGAQTLVFNGTGVLA